MNNPAPADGGSKLRQPAMAVGSSLTFEQPASFPSSEVPGAGNLFGLTPDTEATDGQ